jgi:hypothetical protein
MVLSLRPLGKMLAHLKQTTHDLTTFHNLHQPPQPFLSISLFATSLCNPPLGGGKIIGSTSYNAPHLHNICCRIFESIVCMTLPPELGEP